MQYFFTCEYSNIGKSESSVAVRTPIQKKKTSLDT